MGASSCEREESTQKGLPGGGGDEGVPEELNQRLEFPGVAALRVAVAPGPCLQLDCLGALFPGQEVVPSRS